MLYRNLGGYLREKYGQRLGKICIDGGFTCPNRDGKCGTGGCIYCGERGAGEHIDPKTSIRETAEKTLARNKDELFIAYFQNFTNTYAPIDILRERYDAALISDRIKVLSIGTRPDCIDEDVCRLLAEYKKEREVWVELGFQTANDDTARLINRGYGRSEFERAMALLEKYGLSVIVHVIIGLPSEGFEDTVKCAEYLSRFKLFGLKIHSIYVTRGTVLEKMLNEKLYTPPTLEEYVRSAVYMITHTPEDVIIHRLTGDAPRDLLVAPEWNRDKNAIFKAILTELERRGERQGTHAEKADQQIDL